jgi:predicted kinase
MKLKVFQTVNMGQSIVLDQTSMNRESRTRKLEWCGPRHTRICIDIRGLTVDELDKRVQGRVKRGGRHIPRHVIADMLCKYERPTKDEGFDFIFTLDQ